MTFIFYKTVSVRGKEFDVPHYCVPSKSHQNRKQPKYCGEDSAWPEFFQTTDLKCKELLDLLCEDIVITWPNQETRIRLEQRTRGLLIEEHGGVCAMEKHVGTSFFSETPLEPCHPAGINALQFHHIRDKQCCVGSIRLVIETSGRTGPLKEIRAEAKKCVLLCSSHHTQLHRNDWQLT